MARLPRTRANRGSKDRTRQTVPNATMQQSRSSLPAEDEHPTDGNPKDVRDKPFDQSADRLVFSSYSHIHGARDLAFAIGLRANKGNVHEAVQRIIPMSELSWLGEHETGATAQVADGDVHSTLQTACSKPDCLAAKHTLDMLHSAFQALTDQKDAHEGSLKIARGKLEGLDRLAKRAESVHLKKMDKFDEARSRAAILKLELEQEDKTQAALQQRIASLRQDIEVLTKEGQLNSSGSYMQSHAHDRIEIQFHPTGPSNFAEQKNVADLVRWERRVRSRRARKRDGLTPKASGTVR